MKSEKRRRLKNLLGSTKDGSRNGKFCEQKTLQPTNWESRGDGGGNTPKHTTERLIKGMQMRKLKDILEKRAKEHRKKYEEKVTKQKTWLLPNTSSIVIDPKAAGITAH